MTRPLRALAARLVPALLLLLAVGGCGKSSAIGSANTLVLVHPSDSLWRQVSDTTYAALEPTFFSVREEKKFYAEPVDTADASDFRNLRIFKQVFVFGTPDNRFVQRVADRADVESPSPGSRIHAHNVWATGQSVTAVVLDPDSPVESWTAQLPELAREVERAYRDFVRRRMYVSGRDTVRRDSIGRRFGFDLQFPRVYEVSLPDTGEAGPVVLRNDNPRPSELIRSVLVDWGPPRDSLTAAGAYDRRRAVDSLYYGVPQGIDTERGKTKRLELGGRPALEVTGTWRDEGTDYPAGGPFIARLVDCPGRTFFLDGWVYAPGKDKYQYMLQVREIMSSFRCPGTGSGPPGGG